MTSIIFEDKSEKKVLAEVFKEYEKAAEQGNANAQYNLALCYKNGVEKDEQKAIEWYQKAAEQGYASAQNNLGWCYQHGTGVEKDEQKAVELQLNKEVLVHKIISVGVISMKLE